MDRQYSACECWVKGLRFLCSGRRKEKRLSATRIPTRMRCSHVTYVPRIEVWYGVTLTLELLTRSSKVKLTGCSYKKYVLGATWGALTAMRRPRFGRVLLIWRTMFPLGKAHQTCSSTWWRQPSLIAPVYPFSPSPPPRTVPLSRLLLRSTASSSPSPLFPLVVSAYPRRSPIFCSPLCSSSPQLCRLHLPPRRGQAWCRMGM